VTCITYDERGEALEAAGLREGSVSQHNVEAAAYEAYAAFARQDWAAFMTHFHDDAEVREEPGSVPDPAVYRGRAEIERYCRDYHACSRTPRRKWWRCGQRATRRSCPCGSGVVQGRAV
jgi:SnoaL-like domain